MFVKRNHFILSASKTSTFTYSKEFAKLIWGYDFTNSHITFTVKTYDIDDRNVFLFVS